MIYQKYLLNTCISFWQKKDNLLYLIITLNLSMNLLKTMPHFLDLKEKLSKGCLTTDLHFKDTDWHQDLHFNSSHPDHTKRSIICSQALRLTKMCTFENDFLRHRDKMKSCLQKWAIWKMLLTLKWKRWFLMEFQKIQ